MKPSSQSPRTPSRLSESVHHQLNMYALAASAAGVGMLVLASPAEAKVVYTKAHHYVLLHHPLNIDLNGNGAADFYVRRVARVFTTTYSSRFSATLILASGVQGNGIAGVPGGTDGSAWIPSALHAGREIGSDLQFSDAGFMASRWRDVGRSAWNCGGPWNNATKRYLGLRFEIEGKVHFGWARFNESCNRKGPVGTGARALLTGYAYETIPNKAIIAGKTKGPDVITLEPGSLGALAAGRR